MKNSSYFTLRWCKPFFEKEVNTMFEDIKREMQLSSFKEEWYGIHFTFHSPKKEKKEWLDILYYESLHDFSYRYVSFSSWKPIVQEGTQLPYRNETLPFWVRKIFYKFRK